MKQVQHKHLHRKRKGITAVMAMLYLTLFATLALGFYASVTSRGGVSLDFLRKPIPTTAFDYAVASKGRVSMQKGSITGITGVSSDSIATLMSSKSSSPALSVSGGVIGGDINVIGSGLAS